MAYIMECSLLLKKRLRVDRLSLCARNLWSWCLVSILVSPLVGFLVVNRLSLQISNYFQKQNTGHKERQKNTSLHKLCVLIP